MGTARPSWATCGRQRGCRGEIPEAVRDPLLLSQAIVELSSGRGPRSGPLMKQGPLTG